MLKQCGSTGAENMVWIQSSSFTLMLHLLQAKEVEREREREDSKIRSSFFCYNYLSWISSANSNRLLTFGESWSVREGVCVSVLGREEASGEQWGQLAQFSLMQRERERERKWRWKERKIGRGWVEEKNQREGVESEWIESLLTFNS